MRHPHRREIGGGRAEVGGGGRASLTGGAEDVGLPAGVEAAAVRAGRDVDDTGASVESDRTLAAASAAGRRRGVEGRPQRRVGLRLQRPRLAKPRFGDVHVGIRRQRAIDQRRQRGVMQRVPPAGQVSARRGARA